MAGNSENQRKRGGPGRPFAPGVSGNPSGRPKVIGEIAELAKQYTMDALTTLHEICTDKGAAGPARVAASQVLLDRGWGKAGQPVDVRLNIASAIATDADLLTLIRAGSSIAASQAADTGESEGMVH